MLLPFCVEGYAVAVPRYRDDRLCNCRPAMQGVAGYAIAVPRCREWLVMQLPSRNTGSSAGRALAQIGT